MFDKEYLKKVVTGEIDDAWTNVLKALMWVGSFLYWCIMLIRHALYSLRILKSHRFEQKVISVGNLTVGGVGKTPLVNYLAEYLNSKSKSVVVLMRGYMTKQGLESDEAVLLKVNSPQLKILTGKNRVQIAQDYLGNHKADIFILDDGFQHLKIQRDLDIVVVDCTNPWGNGFLLPRGILRERLPSLIRTQAVVLSKADLGAENVIAIRHKIKEINPDCVVAESIHQPTRLINIKTNDELNLSYLNGKIICVLSAIGAPESFEGTLRSLNAVIEESFHFIDHHSFSTQDIQNVIHYCNAHQIDTVVTTQKDAVKLGKILYELKPEIQFLFLKVQLRFIKGEEDLRGRIDSLFSN